MAVFLKSQLLSLFYMLLTHSLSLNNTPSLSEFIRSLSGNEAKVVLLLNQDDRAKLQRVYTSLIIMLSDERDCAALSVQKTGRKKKITICSKYILVLRCGYTTFTHRLITATGTHGYEGNAIRQLELACVRARMRFLP